MDSNPKVGSAMTGAGHVCTAICAGAAALTLMGQDPMSPPGALAVALTVAGSLLPDVDTETSVAGRCLRPVSLTLAALGVAHRTLTHSLMAALSVGAACWWLSSSGLGAYPWWFLGGFLLHLFLDSLSSQGVLWLWPAQRFLGSGPYRYKRGHHGVYRVGSAGEALMVVLFCGVCVILPAVCR